ncbi:MAG TPA: hypothetical protein ACFCUC_08310 [Desulfobacterales bacterium]
MNPEIGLNIGGQRLRLRLDGAAAKLQNRLSKNFRGFLAPPVSEAVALTISHWDQKQRHHWEDESIGRFASIIKATLERAPRNRTLEKTLATALTILRHTNPSNPLLAQIAAKGPEPAAAFAIAGSNLFLYQPQRRTASILLQKTRRRARMEAGAINGVMFALSCRLIQEGGLLLHGCALEREGRTVLLVGQSGAGKTTAVRLCRPAACFSDDGVVLTTDGGRYMVQPSPFRQVKTVEFPPNGCKKPIASIYLLEKHASDRVTRLPKHEMMLFILQHAIHFFKYFDDGIARRAFETVRQLLETLPSYRLQFTRNADLWELITQPRQEDECRIKKIKSESMILR